ncbi:hypothetical protein L7F22_063320 [Adiantum nelumboides]|nr:hypothetical protein [Adiantum nelumboides]
MPPCVESPVRSRNPVTISQEAGNQRRDNLTRLVGRRKILVQTDTGDVHEIELDRDDNVQAFKKRLQALLHVPMDEAALSCGDLILKSDLNDLKKDSPILLTRTVQRSLSSPCLSPMSAFQVEADSNCMLEVVGGSLCSSKMRVIVKEIAKAVQSGVEPVPISGGLGGAYYFRNSKGENIAIVKPTDEEPLAPNNPKGYIGRVLGQHGLNKAIRVGETGVREVAAYLLDHESFAKVPPTVLVKITHHVFHVNSTAYARGKPRPSVTKLASCQQYVCHEFDACDRGCSGFSVAAVHRIGILDIRIFNTDRHAGNILVKKVDVPGTWGSTRVHVNNDLELIPIDHGLCLPESLEDPYFEWLHWPQASVAFSDDELDYIRRLDAKKDADVLREELPMLRVACLRVLILSTTFLQIATAAGFCLAEIGALMSRDGLEEISQLEMFCLKARQETESELCSGTLEDDNCFLDNSREGDDIQEQFMFDEDDELCEGSSQSDYSGLHPAGLSKPPDVQSPVLAHKVKSMASPGRSADIEYDNFSGQMEILSKNFLYLRCHPMNTCLTENLPSLTKEDNFLSLPAKQRNSCRNGGRVLSRAVSILNCSGRSTPRISQSCYSPESTCHLKDRVSQKGESMNAWRPVKAMSFKSASLSDHKSRSNFLRDEGAFGVSASETHCKANASGSLSAFSFEDMSETEWAHFLDCFEQILQEDFASRCTESVGYRQRLGVSLPAFQQIHFH